MAARPASMNRPHGSARELRAIQITQFGSLEDVLRVVDLEEPPAPGTGEVKVGVEFSPLNKHDLLVVSGALVQPPLPLVLGNEGVARILEVGTGVDTVAVGDLVVLPLFAGAWRERLLVSAEGLFLLPEGSAEQFSMLGSNPPTAGLILSEYTTLGAGDWVVQNAANSGVGRSLIALAKARGFRTINLARDEVRVRRPDRVRRRHCPPRRCDGGRRRSTGDRRRPRRARH
jgi:NADPH:quinone reductase-like Zn-dependent oxidoreductase